MKRDTNVTFAYVSHFICKKHQESGAPVVAQGVRNPTSIHEDVSFIPGLAQWIKDPALLWLWCRPAATAPIRPIAQEPPYASGAALENTKQNKTKKPYKKKTQPWEFPSWLSG